MRRTRSLALVLVLTSLSFGTLAHSAGAAEIVTAKVRPVTIAQAKTHAMRVLREELARSHRGQKVLADATRPDGRFAVPPLTVARLDGDGDPACATQGGIRFGRVIFRTGVSCSFSLSGVAENSLDVHGTVFIGRTKSGRLTHYYVQGTM
jgi:hypothetical protein